MSMAPPRVLERFLDRCLGNAPGRDDVLGDLREEYALRASRPIRARLWYATQALGIGVPYLWRRWWSGGSWGWWEELRYAARSLRRSPTYTSVALFSLFLGIGVNTAAFSLVNAVLFRPLPYPASDRIVDVGEYHPVEVCGGCGFGASYDTYRHWESEATSFSGLGASAGGGSVLDADGIRIQVSTVAATGTLFELLGARVSTGRVLTAEDELLAGASAPVLLSDDLWSRVFSRDPEAVGRTVSLDGVSHTVVGILAEDFRFPYRGDAFVPLTEAAAGGPELRDLSVLGRLAPERTLDQAQRELDLLSARLALDRPELYAGWNGVARPLRDVLLEDLSGPMASVLLLVATAAVLLIACANLASITAARGIERTRDARVRAALGAGTGRIFRFAISESIVLAVVGGGVGILIAYGVSGLIDRYFGYILPDWIQVGIDGRLLIFALLLTVLSILVAGVLPARRSSRVDLSRALRTDAPTMTRGGGAVSGHRLLVGGQISICLMLLAAALLSLRDYRNVSRIDNLGYEPRGVTALSVVHAAESPAPEDGLVNLERELVDRVAALSGVHDVVVEADRFLGTFGSPAEPSPVRVSGRPEPISNAEVPRHGIVAGEGYFELMGIPIRRGRGFTRDDLRGGAGAVVVNEMAAELLWPGENPLGQTLRIDDDRDAGWLTVVGVAGTTVISPYQGSRTGHPRIYTLYRQSPSTRFSILLRSDGSVTPETLVRTIHDTDPDLLVTEVGSVEQRLARWVSGAAILSAVIGGLGALALTLATVGVYGLLSYTVSSHLREIGIRMALGGSARAMGRLVIGRLAPVFGIGAAVGLGGSWALAQFGNALGVDMGTADPTILGAVVLLTATLCAAAAIRPAHRARTVDPITILREE